MANLQSVIKISSEDYATLVGGGTITKGGVTYSYDANALYIVEDSDPPAYAETAGVANRAVADSGGNNIAATYDKKPLVIEVNDTDQAVPSGTFTSITAALEEERDVLLKVIITQDDGQIEYLRIRQDNSSADETYYFFSNWYEAEVYEDDGIYIGYFSANNHSHGRINSDGELQYSDSIIANGDKLVITDASDSNKIVRASLTFDGSTTTQALSKKGTWVSFAKETYNDSTSDQNYVDLGDTLEDCITKLDKGIIAATDPKADKLKNIVIVKSGTSPNYTYSLPSGTTAITMVNDIVTNGTMVVCTLDDEIYYYDRTTGSSSSTVLHFKYTDTTADGVVEKDLAIAYSNNAVTLTTTTADLSSKVSKVTSTDNAIARFDGTGGQIQNSGVTINDSNHVTAAKFITSGGTSNQVVLGDGTLKDPKTFLQSMTITPQLSMGSIGAMYSNQLNNAFYALDKRKTVTGTGFASFVPSYLFNNVGEVGSCKINAGETAVITIGSENDTPFATYTYGWIYVTFYTESTKGTAQSVSIRAYGTKGGTVGWYDYNAAINPGHLSGYTVNNCFRCYTDTIYSIKAWEITIVAHETLPTYVSEVFAIFTRSNGEVDQSVVTKYANAQDLYGAITIHNNLTADKLITKDGTSSQFVKGNGSLDSTTYTPQTSAGANSLLSSLPDWTAVPTDTTKLVRRDTGGSASFGQVTFLTVWNYIKSKISSVLGIGGDNGVPTAPTATAGTNTTQVATTAFVQNALSNMGAGGSEMVDVTITGTTSSASFSTNPYNAIKAVVDDGKIAVLNASVTPLSATGVLIPVYEYTYSQSGSDFTGYKGKIQNSNYEISVDVQSTSSATVTITSVGSSITVDTALSESSTNPVQNAVITAQILENEEIVATALNNLNDRVELKQDQLVSGTTIKTINNQSILGSGNITISGGGGGGGEENVIETVKVNGTALIPDANKAVNITSVPGSIVTQDATHRFVSDTEKSTWTNKQDSLEHYSENNGVNISSSLYDGGDINIVYLNDDTFQPINEIKLSTDGIELSYEQPYVENEDEIKHTVTLDDTGFKFDNKQIATTDQIPSAVTESIVSGWGFTKNAGTITGITMNGSSKGTSGVVNLGTVVTSETDPVFIASAAHGITAQDIANWNAKQNSLVNTQNPYSAQGTSTKVPTITTNNLGQVTTITETDIAFPTLSKGTTSGSGNAVTDISVSGHTITLTKGSTFGTYSKPSGGIPETDLATAVSQRLLPEGNGSTDDGKIVQYSYLGGGWQLVKPITIYTGSSAPSSSTGSNGDIYIQTS